MTSADIGGFDIAAIEVALADYVAGQRWFGRREKRLQALTVDDVARLRNADPPVWFVAISVGYGDGTGDRFSVPLGIVPASETEESVVGRRNGSVLVDALLDLRCSTSIWQAIADGSEIHSSNGRIFASGTTSVPSPSELSRLPADTTNTAVIRDQSQFLKWVRRLEPGPSVEGEMVEALRTGGFHHFPRALGGLHYESRGQQATQLCFLSEYLAAPRAAWSMALESLQAKSSFAKEASELGAITAEMHDALVSDAIDPAMRARPMTGESAGEWLGKVEIEVADLMTRDEPALAAVAANRANLTAVLDAARRLDDYGLVCRIHGDYHLGQVCDSEGRWWVLDFEGEPARSVAERRLHTSPLQDVAGMLRSFDYAAAIARMDGTADAADASKWAAECREAFWSAYVQAVQNRQMLPPEPQARALRRAYEIAKAVYEVRYELGHRPAWVQVPGGYLAEVRP